MSNKISNLMLGAMLGLGTLAFTVTAASAAALLPLSTPAIGEANAVNGGAIQVKHKNSWHKKHSSYCNKWNSGCHNYRRGHHSGRRHHYGRYYSDGSYLFLPLIIGGGYGGYNNYSNDYDGYEGGGWSSRHVRYCLNKYRSYNPRTNTWVSYSGRVKQCYSPYL